MHLARIFLLALFVASAVRAQDLPTAFTLQEAIAFALEHNYSSINASRDLVDAQKQKWEVIADGLPQIDGSINYQDQLIQPVSLIPGDFFPGGEPGTFVPIIFGPPRSTAATATLRQQIFDGSYIVGVQATRAFLSYSANNKEKTDQQVRKEVVESYGNALLAQESTAILERNIAAVEKNLYETRKLYENGLGEEENVEQLQITLANLKNSRNSNERLVTITRQMFNVVMGLPLDHPTEFTQSLDDLVTQETQPQLLETEFQLENNTDYKLVLNLNEQRYFEWKLARSRALPSLDAFINYGWTEFGDPITILGSDRQGFDASVLGFDLKIPIFSSLKRSASTQRAKIALEKAKTELQEAEQMLTLQHKQARSDYILAIENYETSKENLSLAERIENKNEIKYSEGIASSFDLRQAQTQLYTAQGEYLQAMIDVINRKTDLENILNPYTSEN